jgi:hypothetical protein
LPRTRIVYPGGRREDALNVQTMVLDVESLPADAFREHFLSNYKKIRATVERFRRPGVAMIAIDGSGVVSTACVAAKAASINVAIIGRHSMTDLFLDGDPTISLRHMAVLLYPCPDGADPRMRLVDLRTPSAFLDEHGNQQEALEAEGPVFIRLGRFFVYFLPTGEETPWPDDADAGYQCVPARVYLSSQPAEPDRWSRRRLRARRGLAPVATDSEQALPAPSGQKQGGLLPQATVEADVSSSEAGREAGQKLPRRQATPPKDNEPVAFHHENTPEPDRFSDESRTGLPPRRTIVQAISGPSRARRSLLDDDETPIGAMRIRSEHGRSTIIIGGRAAKEGVLFGRYDRCDNEGLPVLANPRISRVHVMLIELASRVYLIDAGSTNGLWEGQDERRFALFRHGVRLMLGDNLAHLEWLRAY